MNTMGVEHRQAARTLAGVGLAALTLLAAAPAAAAPGDLDPEFSRDGKTTLDVDGCESGVAVAAQPDGKVLVAGSTVQREQSIYCSGQRTGIVIRLQADGKIDQGFGEAGTVRLGADLVPTAIAPDDQGRLLVGGVAPGGDIAVTRLLADGASDPSFGTAGIATVPDFYLESLAFDGAGRIVLGGARFGCPSYCVAVVRLLSGGSPDSGFGFGGISTAPLFAMARRVIPLPDGRILAAGGDVRPGTFFARFTDAGALDPTFSEDGIVLLENPGPSTFGSEDADAVVLPDGAAIGVGQANSRMGATKIDGDGVLDVGFGDQGHVIAGPFTPKEEVAWARTATLEPRGSVLALGTTARIGLDPGSGGRDSETNAEDYALARFGPGGTLERAFGKKGKRAIDFWTGEDRAIDGALTQRGAYLAAGTVEDGSRRTDIGLARFTNSPGAPDADADGRKDARDRCPEAFAKGHRGCPRLARRLELGYSATRDSFTGSLTSRYVKCLGVRGGVEIFRARRGRDELVLREGLSFDNTFSARYGVRRGRFYARVDAIDLTIRGVCTAERTPAISLP